MLLRPPSRLPAVRQGVPFSMVCKKARRQAGSLIFLKYDQTTGSLKALSLQ